MISKDESRIRELLAERETAMRAGDVERLVSRYAAGIVKFDLAPPLLNPNPGDVDALKNWLAGFAGPVDYEIRDQEVTAGEDVAYGHSLHRLTATPYGATEKFDLWFRVTVCLRKIDGDWWITHEHNSTPFHMDGSFKAALDLKP
jgi:ketosteroid isomerase-like protein